MKKMSVRDKARFHKLYDQLPEPPEYFQVTDPELRERLQGYLCYCLQKFDLSKRNHTDSVHYYLSIMISEIIFYGILGIRNLFWISNMELTDRFHPLSQLAAYKIAYDLCFNNGLKASAVGEGWDKAKKEGKKIRHKMLTGAEKRFHKLPDAPSEFKPVNKRLRQRLKNYLEFCLRKVDFSRKDLSGSIHFCLAIYICEIILYGEGNCKHYESHTLGGPKLEAQAIKTAYNLAYDICFNNGTEAAKIGEGWEQ
ncbi:MAG: hypothetical protein NTX82_00050 [Candidatus Parcubacteria bacterium]|nr:hypothetical protein [Candidatus Parcubacteria bacterium]